MQRIGDLQHLAECSTELIQLKQIRVDKLDYFIDRLQLERFTAVKRLRPGTHRTLDPPFAIRFDCKGTCTVLGVLGLTFRCQSGKPVICELGHFVSVEELEKKG